MNVEELIKELRVYPPETPVALGISEGTALLVNNVCGILKDDILEVCFLSHIPSEGYFDKDTMRL